MTKLWGEFVIKWRWAIIVLMPVLVAALGYGAKNLEFKTDYRVFFDESNPQLEAFELLQDTYNKSDNILIVVAPQDGQVFNANTIQAVEEITEAGWQLPFNTRVDSLTNYQHTTAYEDDLDVANFIEFPDELSVEDFAKRKKIALAEPLLIHRLISEKGDVTAINITFELPDSPVKEIDEIVVKVRDIREKIETKYPNVEIYLTGMLMMNSAFSESAAADAQTLIPAMFFVVVLVLIILLRSAGTVIASVLLILFSIAAGMGMAGWLGWYLTGPSASAPTIILTMAVADAVHIMMGYIHSLKRGMDRQAAMKESLRINMHPVFLTSLTTIIGFLTLNFSEAPPFRDLGNMVALGVAMAWLLSITFLPALVSVFPIKVTQLKEGKVQLMDRFADWVINKRKFLFIAVIILMGISAAMIPKNELNDSFVEYFSSNIEFRSDTDFVNENITGIYTIAYDLDSQQDGGIAEPEFLQQIEDFANWARSLEQVTHVNTVTDIFKRLNKNMHGDNPEWYKLPEQRELAAQYLLLYEMSLPYGLDLTNQITLDKSATRTTITFKNLTSLEVLETEILIKNWLDKNAPSIKVAAASPNLMFAHIGMRNIYSMLKGALLALVLISIIIGIALKSWKLGLISLAPNLFPAIMAFGLWGLFVGRVGMALAAVASISLGIVVDDTVHFLSKYARAIREKGFTAEQAVRYSFSHVGVALWVTTLVLVAGFMVLSLSDFALNGEMGLLTAVTIALALAVDFLFLPALLIKFQGVKK